mmetsp:Transcript_13769/g.40263  ORF Transcript_13769/g.40263 Transcript_13769/m.40263 type:complete len:669 (-) Transcript_13769:403-2409(-)
MLANTADLDAEIPVGSPEQPRSSTITTSEILPDGTTVFESVQRTHNPDGTINERVRTWSVPPLNRNPGGISQPDARGGGKHDEAGQPVSKPPLVPFSSHAPSDEQTPHEPLMETHKTYYPRSDPQEQKIEGEKQDVVMMEEVNNDNATDVGHEDLGQSPFPSPRKEVEQAHQLTKEAHQQIKGDQQKQQEENTFPIVEENEGEETQPENHLMKVPELTPTPQIIKTHLSDQPKDADIGKGRTKPFSLQQQQKPLPDEDGVLKDDVHLEELPLQKELAASPCADDSLQSLSEEQDSFVSYSDHEMVEEHMVVICGPPQISVSSLQGENAKESSPPVTSSSFGRGNVVVPVDTFPLTDISLSDDEEEQGDAPVTRSKPKEPSKPTSQRSAYIIPGLIAMVILAIGIGVGVGTLSHKEGHKASQTSIATDTTTIPCHVQRDEAECYSNQPDSTFCYEKNEDSDSCQAFVHESEGNKTYCCHSCNVCPHGCTFKYAFDCTNLKDDWLGACDCPPGFENTSTELASPTTETTSGSTTTTDATITTTTQPLDQPVTSTSAPQTTTSITTTNMTTIAETTTPTASIFTTTTSDTSCDLEGTYTTCTELPPPEEGTGETISLCRDSDDPPFTMCRAWVRIGLEDFCCQSCIFCPAGCGIAYDCTNHFLGLVGACRC